jgi:lysylphosphatidylglycerol synthetase-like protein (DUF2156 family)
MARREQEVDGAAANGRELDDRSKLAFSSVGDACKQILSLTTAIVTLTIAFAKDIAVEASVADQRWLTAAWMVYAVSVLAGSWTLLALTGSLGRPDIGNRASIYRSNITIPATLQMATFSIGVTLTVCFGIFSL